MGGQPKKFSLEFLICFWTYTRLVCLWFSFNDIFPFIYFLLKKHHVSLFVGPQMFLNIGMWLHQWGGQFNDYNTPNISYLGASPCIYLNAMCPPWICSSLGISLLEEIQKIGWPPLIGETDMYFIIWWVHLHFIVGRVTPYNPDWLVQEGRERQAQ